MTRKTLVAQSIVSFSFLAFFAAAAGAPGRIPHIFFTADRCISCHNGIVSPHGEDISFGTDWRPSMMANAARDPYWHAGVRRESLIRPALRAAIEDECSACHMPMARFEAKAAGGSGQVFAHLPVTEASSPAGLLSADGVSCSLCHQIRKDNLGQASSFIAGFMIDTKTPLGQRQAFGPYEVDKGRQALMRSSSRFVQTEAAHLRESELCATCHTLYTDAMDLEGKVVGRLPEQVPFQEWAHSSYRDSRSCQSCHMPAVDGETPITGVLGKPRSGVGRHVFLAANFFMPRVFNRFRSDTGVAALPQELDAAARRTVEHLQTASAGLTIESLEVKDGRLEALVRVDNAAGHKLPTAYPSRRAWVHFTVRDGRNEVVFESGRFNRDGSIAGNDNDADGSLYEPHYGRVEKQDQVQVYEAVMAGPDDKVTTVLLTAVRYLKDNRLLPNGFVKTTAGDDIAVKGGAAEDGDFTAGGDRVLYVADLGQAVGPFQVEAELRYQPIGYRWAHNLALQESAEGKRFLSFYDQLSEQSAVILAKCLTTAKTP